MSYIFLTSLFVFGIHFHTLIYSFTSNKQIGQVNTTNMTVLIVEVISHYAIWRDPLVLHVQNLTLSYELKGYNIMKERRNQQKTVCPCFRPRNTT